MKHASLVLLRVSLGLFLVVWGGDKLVNADHAVAVSEGFYLGLVSAPALVTLGGLLEIVAGLMVVAGWGRRVAYPFLVLVTTATLLAVWRSIVDPLGLFLEGGNPVFFSSLVIEAGALVLWAFRDGVAPAPGHEAGQAAPAARLAAD